MHIFFSFFAVGYFLRWLLGFLLVFFGLLLFLLLLNLGGWLCKFKRGDGKQTNGFGREEGRKWETRRAKKEVEEEKEEEEEEEEEEVEEGEE